jgi:uncharacterized protein (DUF362 family)
MTMERRDFLKIGAGGAAGLAASGVLSPLTGVLAASARPDLVVVHGIQAETATRAAVDAMGGMKAFITKGDVVVIKPNIGWDRTPEQAADTNPAVVATLILMCLEAGAKKVKVFDRTCNDPRRCYVQSGIEPAAQKAGAEVSHIDDRKFKEVAIPKGEAIKSWPLYRDILEADKIINVPIAKHHSLSGLTLSFKNWMGVMGGSRGRIHQNINESLVDLATVIRPTLVILDAVRILTANGPQGGNLKDVKQLDTIIAGVDQVAVDSYGATLFGKMGADLGVVAAAHRRGMGTMDLDKLIIKRIEA